MLLNELPSSSVDEQRVSILEDSMQQDDQTTNLPTQEDQPSNILSMTEDEIAIVHISPPTKKLEIHA